MTTVTMEKKKILKRGLKLGEKPTSHWGVLAFMGAALMDYQGTGETK